MDRDELRAIQAPLKERYADEPEAALVTLRADGALGEGVSCSVRPGGRSPRRACIRRPAATARCSARATCCSRRWSPAPG